MIWWDGAIEEVDSNGFHCLATGLHRWKNIRPLSKTVVDEMTHTWWMVRRFVAWAAKVPNNNLPPVEKGENSEKTEKILKKQKLLFRKYFITEIPFVKWKIFKTTGDVIISKKN